MKTTDVPSRVSETVSREIQGDTFIMDVTRSQLHDLNAVGGRIWELVDGQRTVDGIVDALVEEYDVDRERAGGEVLAYLEVLREKGLIA
jgi:Coenzyme PQQ synthesis protein D (PqqD)